MESAGRILLMPKGDYSASATYEMLDMVNHSGASWVCKKPCTGQAPSDSNTEFWQRVGTAVDLAKYFKNTGGQINGDVTIESADINGVVKLFIKNKLRNISLELGVNGDFWLWDNTFNKSIITSNLHGVTTVNGTASGNVPLDGGGRVKKDGASPLELESTSATSVWESFYSTLGYLGRLGFSAKETPAFMTTGGGVKELLHTGNKPTGSYYGNGEARTVNVGGIGSSLKITGNNITGTVTDGGITGLNLTNNQFYGENYNGIKFVDGVLTISAGSGLNKSGVYYSYQVL